MNNIDDMPPKCHDCPYWEVCEEPYICPTLDKMVTKDKPNKVTATLKIVITGEFYDDEASEETLRYCAEQALEDAGFDVDVSVMHNHRLPFSANSNVQWTT